MTCRPDPVHAQATFEGRFGRWTCTEAIDRAVCLDLVAHGWDLARATGQDERIGPPISRPGNADTRSSSGTGGAGGAMCRSAVRLLIVSMVGELAFARVMAHCGGSPGAAVSFIARAVATDPRDPLPYSALEDLRRELPAEVAAVVATANTIGPMLARAYLSFVDGDMDEAAMSLGAVAGYQPDVPWASAPWFGDERFLAVVTPAALAEATMRIRDYDRDLDTDAVRECLAPWLRAIEVICDRRPDPDAMARMAILLRACGRVEASFALCDRADAVRRVMLTEVVRAGTWRHVGNRAEAAAAFRRALALEPANWSLYLDLADLAAENGDFAEAAALATRGEELERDDITMRAAAAAYRARATGSVADLDTLTELAPQVPEPYRRTLINYARDR